MFGFLKRKKKETSQEPILADLNQNPLSAGDTVESLRYDLGICRVIKTDKGLTYESTKDGRQVSWHRMVDAATELQKVHKITVEDN